MLKLILLTLLALTVVDAAKPDFGVGKWWIKNDNWRRYPAIKKGMPLFIKGCRFAMGDPTTTKPNNIGRIIWKSDTRFWAFADAKPNRKMVFNRDTSD